MRNSVIGRAYLGGATVAAAAAEAADEAETTALVARFTTPPTTARKAVINTLILALKAAGVWSKLDVLYVFAAADSQAALLNWVSTSFDGTATNTPTFAANRGYTGGATNKNVGTGFNAATAPSPKFTQNSASVGGYSRTNNTSNGYDVTNGVGAGSTRVTFRNASGNFLSELNDSTAQQTMGAVTDSLGPRTATRNGTAKTAYVDADPALTGTTLASISPASANFQFLGIGAAESTRQLAAGWIGGYLTQTEVQALHAAVEGYMANADVGANV